MRSFFIGSFKSDTTGVATPPPSYVAPDYGWAAKDYTGTAVDTNISSTTNITPLLAGSYTWQVVHNTIGGSVQRHSAVTGNPLKVLSTVTSPTPGHAILQATSSLSLADDTVAIRLRLTSNSGGDQFVVGTGNATIYQIRWNAGTGSLTCYSGSNYTSVATTNVGSLSGTLSANTWYTLVIKYTGSSTSIYVLDVAGSISGAALSATNIFIGKGLGSNNVTTNTTCAGILGWNNTTISDAQIAASITNYL